MPTPSSRWNRPQPVPGADVTVTTTTATLDDVRLGEKTLDQARSDRSISFKGNEAKFDEFLGLLVDYPFWFNIVTP